MWWGANRQPLRQLREQVLSLAMMATEEREAVPDALRDQIEGLLFQAGPTSNTAWGVAISLIGAVLHPGRRC
jgi:hypothetical protein